MRDAGRRQRRHRAMKGIHLRRQRRELTGHSLQIRLLGFRALRELLQGSCMLLLRRLNIPQPSADDGIRYRGGRRLGRRCCSNAIGFRRRGAIEIRQGEVVEFREREAVQFRQRQGIEIRQEETVGIRQEVGGSRANDRQGGQRHHCRRHARRGPLAYGLSRLVCLRFLVRCLSHLRFLTSAQSQPRHRSENKEAAAWDDPAATHRAIAHSVSAQIMGLYG